MELQPTGDAALDALFADAAKMLEDDDRPVSLEPVKTTPGAIQNSGVVSDGDDVLVPVLTADELANNTPTYGKPLERVQSPKGISTPVFLTLISNAYALYVLHGVYDVDRLVERTGLAAGVVSRVLASGEFLRAMKLRGVEQEITGLTREQELCLQVLLDPSDGKTLGQKLKQVKVSYSKYQAWMKNSVFKAHVDQLSAGLLHNNADALVQLERLVTEGDLPAIKFKMELNGTYDPNKQNNIDIVALMGKMLEIISIHVRDPQALRGVAGDLGELAKELRIGEVRQIGY